MPCNCGKPNKNNSSDGSVVEYTFETNFRTGNILKVVASKPLTIILNERKIKLYGGQSIFMVSDAANDLMRKGAPIWISS